MWATSEADADLISTIYSRSLLIYFLRASILPEDSSFIAALFNFIIFTQRAKTKVEKVYE